MRGVYIGHVRGGRGARKPAVRSGGLVCGASVEKTSSLRPLFSHARKSKGAERYWSEPEDASRGDRDLSLLPHTGGTVRVSLDLNRAIGRARTFPMRRPFAHNAPQTCTQSIARRVHDQGFTRRRTNRRIYLRDIVTEEWGVLPRVATGGGGKYHSQAFARVKFRLHVESSLPASSPRRVECPRLVSQLSPAARNTLLRPPARRTQHSPSPSRSTHANLSSLEPSSCSPPGCI